MVRDLIRQAQVALQHVSEARTVEYQSRFASEARRAFDAAMASARARFDEAEKQPTPAARTIARHAIAFVLDELASFEARLTATEARLANLIAAQIDPRDFRRMYAIE
jgi:hypothetical protein